MPSGSLVRIHSNIGQDIQAADLEGIQIYGKRVVDMLIAGMGQQLFTSGSIYTSNGVGSQGLYCYTPGNGGFPICVSGSNLAIAAQPGVICQWSGSNPNDGSGELLVYYVSGSELSYTCQAADPTNPRVDSIDIQLQKVPVQSWRDFQDPSTGLLTSQLITGSYTVTLTSSYNAGYAEAGPAIAAIVPGWCRWASVYIPANKTDQLDPFTNLMDWTMPVGPEKKKIVNGRQIMFSGSTWSQSGPYGQLISSNGIPFEAMALFDNNTRARVTRLVLYSTVTDAPLVVAYDYVKNTSYNVALSASSISSNYDDFPIPGSSGRTYVDLTPWPMWPLWGDGSHAARAVAMRHGTNYEANAQLQLGLQLEANSGGQIITGVEFHYIDS